MTTPEPPQISVIIPAHNESSVIDRCLASLFDGVDSPASVDVVVVANGCTDDTAQRARRWTGVRVVEAGAIGKAGALNLGDHHALAPLRAFVDADAVLAPGTLDAAVAALAVADARAASPLIVPATDGPSALVRAYARVWSSWPKWQQGQIGAGFYAVNAAGRARFTEFPNLFADDLFVESIFAPDERIILRSVPGRFHMASSFRTLIQVEARRHRARRQLDDAVADGTVGRVLADGVTFHTAATEPGWLGPVIRQPRRVPDVVVYVVVKVASRVVALKSNRGAWVRDR
jgi:glycosyltransferase involved in cell wall biosynthesis